MANKGITYTSRNFSDIRTDLVNLVKQYYPDVLNDFNDASVGMMLLELNAAVGDMLSFNTDRNFQETQIDYAQENKSVLSLARTFGLNVPGKRPSVTIVDFSVTVPPYGNTFDLSYTPLIKSGAQATGAGKIFETQYDIDFSSPFTIGGIPNRLVIPNFNSNGNLLNYTITKREIVVNGFTKVYTQPILVQDVKPFLEVILPDTNVLSIDSAITLNGTDFQQSPTLEQFLDLNNRWFEVDALAESDIFIEDSVGISDNPSIRPGKWITTNRRFIREYTDLGYTKIIFGGGNIDTSSLCDFDTNTTLVNQIGDFINNMSLGETHSANTTLFIKYRVGGGSDTNLGTNVINSLGNVNMVVNGSDPVINNAVQTSLNVNNAFPALGGRDEPSIEEIRNLVRYNFASQNRAVTIKDYQTKIAMMPGKFGVPFRTGIFEEQNKIQIYILGLDENTKLSNTSTTTLINNISEYLADYRMINDYVMVSNGKIINIGFEVDLFVDKKVSQSEIMSQVIVDIENYLNINNYQMGDNIYLSNLVEIINNVGGVLNVIDLRVYNNVGGDYSLNEISQPYIDTSTRQINISYDYTLYGEPISMFEIKYPEKDIKIRVKN
jgi:Baseplate J-like protein